MIPLIEEIKLDLSPIQVYEIFKTSAYSFILDSGTHEYGLGEYAFIGGDPFLLVMAEGSDVKITYRDSSDVLKNADVLEVIKRILSDYQIENNIFPVPFCGGCVGYFSYDFGRTLEKIPNKAKNDSGIPDCCLAFYDLVIAYSYSQNKFYVVSTGFPEKGLKGENRAEERLKLVLGRLRALKGKKLNNSIVSPSIINERDILSNFTKASYLGTVNRIKEYIAAGDIYQVNLSQRFIFDLCMDSFELYKRLTKINPAPFEGFLNFGEESIISASPERFLSLRDGVVRTRPMKGTRPRGKTKKKDERLKNDLLKSEKDKAELIMIVDLERNDIGKVCEYGSVYLESRRDIEKYSTVFQTTSTVRGLLSKGKDRIDLLRACFPGGSITGAPKIRAMEIIEELEPTRRGIYTGSLGYLSFSGEMDLNILIRTLVAKKNEIRFQVGGGIVADSVPEEEYQETLDKAKALFSALGVANPLK
ncbi:MAG: aminodeoxychorismate synthase component I [bacterium]|nr:aminodeoxychorismate synthase component I [bacterium]